MIKMKTQAMLDTNVFNDLLDGHILVDALDGFELYATHVQIDEINNTKESQRRESLLKKFSEVSPTKKPTSSAVWGVSNWDESCWSDGKNYEEILQSLQEKQKNPKRKHDSNIKDALIAETAIQQGMTLVTADVHLAEVVESVGGTVLRLSKHNV